ncbi:hypothetical protein IFR05_014228 [Cadophora sp. M221]|nr:hypothetical protein IFR05_014228 [Cadophora sp. M221]
MVSRTVVSVYDDIDDATSAAILEVQIRDIDDLVSEAMRAKPVNNSNEPSEWGVALYIHKKELERGLSTIRDRQLSQTLARAVMIDANANNNALAAAIAQERLAENDRLVALKLAGLPVPPRIQQALAGLGTPTPPQTTRLAGIPPHQLPGGGAASTPPQTPQGHRIPAFRLIANKETARDKRSEATSPVPNKQPRSKDQAVVALQSGTTAADRSCTATRPQKRKFEGEENDPSQAKRLNMRDTTEINSGTKRRRDDENSGHNPNKRRDTGARKIVDLTADFEVIPKYSGPGKQSPPKYELKSCVCCADDFEPTYTSQMPCKHDYCHFCVQRVVINSLVNETLYPPRCCKQPFDMDSMRQALTPELISGFYEKKVEFETVDRTYCSNPTCSTFLYPVNIVADTGTCPKCLTTTCVMCKAATHKGDCLQDTATQQVLALANAEGLKRCEHCKRMIELKHGCNHITCACGAE